MSKKYHIIKTIENDAPFENISSYTISFLTPQNIDKLKHIDIRGFKVHDGYNNPEAADEDVKIIRERNKNHDVYVAKMGKLCAWDDATKSDAIQYDDRQLNDLEKTRRENVDKIKLMKEQLGNEFKVQNIDPYRDRLKDSKDRLREKLYDKGLISKEEYELANEIDQTINDVKDINDSIEKLNPVIEECYKTDYLDENEPTAFKFGSISIFSPRCIKGLKTLCFKIRGLYQTPAEMRKHVRKLEKQYPHDPIYRFEIGKWTAYSENNEMDELTRLKRLNYCMKCHLDNLEHEREEFVKRKENLQKRTEQEAKIVRANNRKEKRKAMRRAKKTKQTTDLVDSMPNDQGTLQHLGEINPELKQDVISLGIKEDDEAIQNIINYLDDPALRNKYAADKSTLQTVEISQPMHS